jgi:hypothetical protein
MEEKLKEYYLNLENISSIKDKINLKKEEFEKSIKFEIDFLESLESSNTILKESITKAVVEEFLKDGKKQRESGLGIRVSSKLRYSEEDAINWAKQNMPVAIKQEIDKRQFESYAKDKELDFVKKEDQITVTFPKELKYGK